MRYLDMSYQFKLLDLYGDDEISFGDLFGELDEPDLSFVKLRGTEGIGIVVTCAGHPSNFVFQVEQYQNDLEELEAAMSAYYNCEETVELNYNEILYKKTYAACDHQLVWHRVVVLDVPVVGGRVAVRLCDYGIVIPVPISGLRQLKEEFLRPPCMAFRGNLAGVSPLVVGWTSQDCSRFKDLVEFRQLKGIIIGSHDADPSETIYYLHLFDTSSGVSVNIADVLVAEKRAIHDG